MTPDHLKASCLAAVLADQDQITLVMDGQHLKAARRAKFPRGELLSVNAAGDHNTAFDPLDILRWLRGQLQLNETPSP